MRNALVLLPVFCLFSAAEDPERDFTGEWKLNEAQSSLAPLPAPPPQDLKIEHKGTQIHCTGTAIEAACLYNTDGSIARFERQGVSVSSKTKWEGRSLLVNSVVSGPRNYTRMDRWTLSKDRNTLRIRRQIVGLHGETEATLVYERQGVAAATPPMGAASEPVEVGYIIDAGTKIPLKLINTLSTKSSNEGDRIYLQTAFPVMSRGRVVIPAGSYVIGTLTQVARPGRVKGRGELYLRFDSLSLPNGVTRDFRSRPGGVDGDVAGKLDRDEGRIRGEGNKSGDARRTSEAAATGASIGAIAGSIGGRSGMGVGIGAAGGAAAGLAGVLLSRGPDTVLPKGTVVEMVLDRELRFEVAELSSTAARN